MILKDELVEDDIFEEDWSDYDDPDYEYDPEIGEQFMKELLPILNDLIHCDDSIIEKFTTNGNLVKHFNKHCIGKSTSKKSERHRVFYDFEKVGQYEKYEKLVSSKIDSSFDEITTLYDYDLVIEYLQKLFHGNMVVKFTKSCGLQNNGKVSLSLIAFSSDVTTNYKSGNTVDICVKNDMKRTITLYPVDANYLQTKLNNVFKKFNVSDDIPEFKFNND